MINTYYLKNKNMLEQLEDLNCLERYHHYDDPRNYAFIYVYPNGIIERVMRTVNLNYHSMAIRKLYDASKILSQYITQQQSSDLLHYDCDENLARQGVMSIYYSNANLNDDEDEEAFGYINIPECPNDFQKKFLLDNKKYFQIYEEVLITKYSDYSGTLESLNRFGNKDFIDIIDQIIGIEMDEKKHPYK